MSTSRNNSLSNIITAIYNDTYMSDGRIYISLGYDKKKSNKKSMKQVLNRQQTNIALKLMRLLKLLICVIYVFLQPNARIYII